MAKYLVKTEIHFGDDKGKLRVLAPDQFFDFDDETAAPLLARGDIELAETNQDRG
jgi:hypothetical protein